MHFNVYHVDLPWQSVWLLSYYLVSFLSFFTGGLPWVTVKGICQCRLSGKPFPFLSCRLSRMEMWIFGFASIYLSVKFILNTQR